MSRTPIRAAGRKASLPVALVPSVRVLTLAGATLTTGLTAGVFCAYAVSVNPGLALQPDAGYVATMQAINREIQNPVFFLGFFGAVLTLLSALAAHSPRPRSGRFRLVALASALYVGGGFLLTVFINVPMNEELAGVAADASPGELAGARAAYEDPWDFWNGVRTVFSSLAFLALVGACLLREERGPRPGTEDASPCGATRHGPWRVFSFLRYSGPCRPSRKAGSSYVLSRTRPAAEAPSFASALAVRPARTAAL